MFAGRSPADSSDFFTLRDTLHLHDLFDLLTVLILTGGLRDAPLFYPSLIGEPSVDGVPRSFHSPSLGSLFPRLEYARVCLSVSPLLSLPPCLSDVCLSVCVYPSLSVRVPPSDCFPLFLYLCCLCRPVFDCLGCLRDVTGFGNPHLGYLAQQRPSSTH